MEKITNIEFPRKSWFTTRALILALWGALSFTSCDSATGNDVLDKQQELERIEFQLSSNIESRKELGEKYNKLLKYPRTKSNEWDIDRSLSGIYQAIVELDEKIQTLEEDRLNAEKQLNECKSNAQTFYAPNKPIALDKWDHLLVK